MNDDMKLIVATAGDCRTGWSLSLGFGSHPSELVVLNLVLKDGLSAPRVADRLREFADSVEQVRPEEEDELWLRTREAAWKRLLKASAMTPDIYPPLRQGGRKTRGRNVALPPQRENPMANKKTAKKVAKKVEAKKAAMKKVVAKKAK